MQKTKQKSRAPLPESDEVKIFVFAVNLLDRPLSLDNIKVHLAGAKDIETAQLLLSENYRNKSFASVIVDVWDGHRLVEHMTKLLGGQGPLSDWQAAAALRYTVMEHADLVTATDAKAILKVAQKIEDQTLTNMIGLTE